VNTEFPENWAAEAEDFLRHFASTEGATLERQQLTELLVGFRLRPIAGGAAPVSIIVSPYQVIVEAGRGTRFELDALPVAGDEVKEILDAIADGRLYERSGLVGLRFKLELRSGRTLSGRMFGRRGIGHGTVQYQPYGFRASDEPGEEP
jgi:hypothetical protein